MSRTKTFGIGLLLAAGTGLVLWSSCGASQQAPKAGETAPAGPAPAQGTTAPAATPAAPAGAAVEAGTPEGTAPPSATAPQADAGADAERPGSSIVRAVGAGDPRDLALLSRIERELGRNPPPEIHALIERRKQGASRDELTRRARDLPDLQLRVLALRWVEELFGASGAAAPAAPAPGSASPLVKPVTKTR
jgi:hypothetical protein